MAATTEISKMIFANRPVHEPTAERMVPESSDPFTFWEHVYRYAFASRFVKGKRVLDIACGEGYGAASLEKAGAAYVIGIDVSEAVCLHARAKYGIDARPGTAAAIPLPDGSVDVVVSFETIEHVPSPDRFLDECARVLAPSGILIISTPNKVIYDQGNPNPYHCSEMTEQEFANAVGTRFHECRFYTQRPKSVAWWSLRTLACDDRPWKRVRGFPLFRRALQRYFIPETNIPPTYEQRESVLHLILSAEKSPRRLLNPFALRPQRGWTREKPLYLIATAIR
jgi:2-polyprenyl-3-methyl-5-hydroxy-6-metoxy-1,4-benzoquinol methylase